VSRPRANPFRIHGVVTDRYFTNRAAELARVQAVLGEPGAKLLVHGPRRMGKTSVLTQAIENLRARGGIAFLADLSTATTPVDMANRVLEAATRAIGARWRDAVSDLAARLQLAVTLTPEPVTGLILPSFEVSLRARPVEEQRGSLVATLDAINALARARKATIGVVLDEFQEIHRFGGESAEWQLRGAIQHHGHVSYVLAGSEAALIRRMVDKGRAFYQLADQMEFGPIDPGHLAKWIETRMRGAGVDAKGSGGRIVALAGPGTRDIVQLARRCFENARASGRVAPADAAAALEDVVAEQAPLLETTWNNLTAIQQNVLRALSTGLEGLTTRATLERFALPSSGSAVNTAAALVESGILRRIEPRGFAFESPFFSSWVRQRTIGDLGIRPE
jgi:hypothetical protein